MSAFSQHSKTPFEVHITVDDMPVSLIDSFVHFCQHHEAKPLLIELAQGLFHRQPMLSKVLWATELESVLSYSQTLCTALRDQQLTPIRIKIEIPAHLTPVLPYTHSENYFEWHGKIEYETNKLLLHVCLKHQAHLSRNALNLHPNIRFITLREYSNYEQFLHRLQLLKSDLQEGNWTILKEQHEYCVYDTNIVLDQGWLS